MDNRTIGERIKQKRLEKGLSQEELAKLMGYSTRNAIYQFEQKDNMKLSLVEKFSKVLGCTPGYLMGWEDKADIIVQAAGEKTMLETPHSGSGAFEHIMPYLTQLTNYASLEKYLSLPEELKKQADDFIDYLYKKSPDYIEAEIRKEIEKSKKEVG